MEYLSKTKIRDKKWILQFVPLDLIFLTKIKKISWKEKQLKTDYIIHLINYMICKFYHTDKKEVNLSSEVLRKWYGTYYNFYLDYLLHHEILIKSNNYFVGLQSNAYLLNEKYYIKGIHLFTRYKNKNIFLLRKWKLKQLEFEVQSLSDTKIINPWVKTQLIDDLYHVEIDYESASKLLLQMYYNGELDSDKSYLKNILSIESIKDGTLFYIEDNYGRLHTNFTVLKKVIRKEFVTIGGEPVEELDIPNSQPTFLSILLKERDFHIAYPKAYEYYRDVVKSGKIYELLADELKINRNECKKSMFYVLFGENKWNTKFDKAFKKFFPEVFEWMINEKMMNDHKTISHELQKRESKLIFDNIIFKIKKQIPDIKLFTVHDSILFPAKYKEQVSEIFYNQVDLLFS